MTVLDHTPTAARSNVVLLTTQQLAARWSVSVGALANDRAAGRSVLPYIKIGERVRYRLSDVLAYEEGALHQQPTLFEMSE